MAEFFCQSLEFPSIRNQNKQEVFILQPGTHWTTLILLQQLKSNQTSHTTVSSEQKYVVAMLNTKAGLANTVLADILQNIDHEVNRPQIKTNSKRDRKCLLH